LKKTYNHLNESELLALAEKYPGIDRNAIDEIEIILSQKSCSEKAEQARISEVEVLRKKALELMGTSGEMKFSDIESGMLRASLSDGRQALKDILETMPVKVPVSSDGTKAKNMGRKKNA
jgi:hypothetical protein